MFKFLILFSALFIHTIHAEVFVQRIILQGSEKSTSKQKNSIVFAELSVPGGNQKLETQLQPYLGQPINKETLLAIKKEIVSYYASVDHPLVLIRVPEQSVKDGTVRVIVTEARAGEITYVGNCRFSDRTLERYLHLKPGQPIDQDLLLNDIASMNRSPFHNTNASLIPGTAQGLTDIELVTKDRFPLRTYAGADNTGNQFSENVRLYAGFNYGNMFWIGDLLTYQFTMAPSYKDFSSHFASYTSFLPWGHTMVVYGALAWIEPDIQTFRSTGKSSQLSFRYQMPFKPYYKPFFQELRFGFDYKGTNSDLFFIDNLLDAPLITHQVNLTQITLGYQSNNNTPKNQWTITGDLFFSPGPWLANQKDSDFNDLRAHAKNIYAYGRFSFGDIVSLPRGFSFASLLRMQAATGPLLPSEQYGLGGYNTVRGYDERQFNADNAINLGVEIRSPSLNIKQKLCDELIFLAFVDYGFGTNYQNELPEVPSSENLLSTGLGARYLIQPYVSARADYGFKLLHPALSGGSLGKFHLSITAGY